MFSSEIECDGCGEMIAARTRRLLCENTECAYHICSDCKTMAESGTGEGSATQASNEVNKRDRMSGTTPIREKRGRIEAADDPYMAEGIVPAGWKNEQVASEARMIAKMEQ
eukprot:10171686-Karenia_brevis.AAC.1